MQEQLLHFIWYRKLFNATFLSTTDDQKIEIIHPGFPNQDQGPDFLQARIKIDDQLWAGHVEIHVLSSAWFLHSHETDPHYNNVILHVVWQEDKPALTSEGFKIPCLELHQIVDQHLLHRYDLLMNNQEWVPCASSLQFVPDLIRISWIERLIAERMERKTGKIEEIMARCTNDYEQAFFVLLMRHLGSPSNSEAMEWLGVKLPLSLLRKHSDRIDQIEAMLFGVAGMLSSSTTNDYPSTLVREFNFLKTKYGLSVIPALQWKFMRMRPPHFPTIRIAQSAVLISNTAHFITLLSELKSAVEWIKLFMVKPAHIFWKDHYHFKSASPATEKTLGKETAISLVINVVAPFMFYYSKKQGLMEMRETALKILSELPAERNTMITKWSEHGWPAKDAIDSQALIQLKQHYCDPRRCVHCAVGMQVLKK